MKHEPTWHKLYGMSLAEPVMSLRALRISNPKAEQLLRDI